MSSQATGWAWSVQVGSPTRKAVLTAFADHAHKDGRNAWASKETIAEHVECSAKTVKRHVQALVADGWMREGDQSIVAHIRADRRPKVYDLAMSEAVRVAWKAEYDAAARGDNTSPRPEAAGGQHVPPPQSHGGTLATERGDTAMSPKPNTNPEAPLPPTTVRSSHITLACPRHGTTPATNCRGCGTTARQIEDKRRRVLAEQRREADRQAAAASHAARAEAAPLTDDVRTALRAQVAAAKSTTRATGGTR